MKIDKRKFNIALAEAEMNQRKLAKSMNVSESYLSNMVNKNNPKIESVERIANELGKKVEDITEERK